MRVLRLDSVLTDLSVVTHRYSGLYSTEQVMRLRVNITCVACYYKQRILVYYFVHQFLQHDSIRYVGGKLKRQRYRELWLNFI